MAEQQKSNNILYTTLVVVGLLLIIIPFIAFDLGESYSFSKHMARFGMHLLAFLGAVLAGSIFTAVVTKAMSSIVTLKITAWASALVIGSAITYNIIDSYKGYEATLPSQDSIKTEQLALNDTTNAIGNSADTLSEDRSTVRPGENGTSGNEAAQQLIREQTGTNTNTENKTGKTTAIIPEDKTTKDKTTKEKTMVSPTNGIDETCTRFDILHGSGLLNRSLGLSVYDPNKTIRFSNACGCILKDADVKLARGNNTVEQKKQNGNYLSLHGFKDLQADDKLTVEIRQANCRDSKGTVYPYTFPTPILTVILISDHREYETPAELKNNKKNAKELLDNSNTPAIKKDKIEESSNQFGN